jgi:hypothetical protein
MGHNEMPPNRVFLNSGTKVYVSEIIQEFIEIQ